MLGVGIVNLSFEQVMTLRGLLVHLRHQYIGGIIHMSVGISTSEGLEFAKGLSRYLWVTGTSRKLSHCVLMHYGNEELLVVVPAAGCSLPLGDKNETLYR